VEVYLYTFLNLGVRWGRVVNAAPLNPVPMVQVDGVGNLAPEIRSPDRPGRSQSLAIPIELTLPTNKTVCGCNITLFLVRVIVKNSG
jgi:hypothetical protein